MTSLLPAPAPFPTIQLTSQEMLEAAGVGIQRMVQDLANGAQSKWGDSGKQLWQNHIEGALGEKSVAKYFGLPWDGNLGNYRAPDAGWLQVRTTWNLEYRLTLHPEDKDIDTFVLVTGIYGKYVLKGWLLGKDGKNLAYWSDPTHGGRYAYFVPNTALRSVYELRKAYLK